MAFVVVAILTGWRWQWCAWQWLAGRNDGGSGSGLGLSQHGTGSDSCIRDSDSLGSLAMTIVFMAVTVLVAWQ